MAVKGQRYLSMVDSAKLVMLIQNEYSKSKMMDSQFAEFATKQLGFQVLHSHILSRRQELGITAGRMEQLTAKKQTVIGRVEQLEKEVAELKEKLKDLLR